MLRYNKQSTRYIWAIMILGSSISVILFVYSMYDLITITHQPFPITTLLLSYGLLLGLFLMLALLSAKIIKLVLRDRRIEEERFRIMLNHINESLFDNVLEADITEDKLLGKNTEKLTKLLGISKHSTYTDTIYSISSKLVKEEFSEEYRKVLSKEAIQNLYEQGLHTFEYECIERSDGIHYAWIRLHLYIFKSKITNTIRIISYVKDIDQEKREMQELKQQAEHDLLTGLLNKQFSRTIAENLLKNHPEQTYAFMVLDIDDFKKINDDCGHLFGDGVLQDVAKQLKQKIGASDIAGRIGGDEFFILMNDGLNKEKIAKKATEICNTIYSCQDGVKYPISFSIGITTTYGESNFDRLFEKADNALYQAKNNGKNQYVLHENTKNSYAEGRHTKN